MVKDGALRNELRPGHRFGRNRLRSGSYFVAESAGHSPELGEDIVIKIPNTPRLGFHIREIPPDLEIKPSYDPARVNRKLRAQVGNPLFDSMVEPYNDLYERILAILHRGGLEAIQSIAEDDEVETYLVYLLKTPGMRRRLEDIAFLDSGGDPREVVMCNGLVDVIEAPRGQVSTSGPLNVDETGKRCSSRRLCARQAVREPILDLGRRRSRAIFSQAKK